MSLEAIQAFNQRLMVTDNRYDIIEYIKNINNLSKNKIDISFMQELMEFITKDECCIPHALLVKYKVITNDKDVSHNIKNMLEQYEFTENEDYLIVNVHDQLPSGTKHKKEYYLHPDTFKFCLMRARNTRLYAKYYLLLEKSIKHYHDYQIMYNEHLLKQKDSSINILSAEIKEQKKQLDEQSREIRELLNYAREAKENQSVLQNKLDDASAELKQTNVTLGKILNKLDDCAHIPKDDNLKERFVILRKKDSDEYYVLRRQQKGLNSAINQQIKKGYELIDELNISQRIPNSVAFWNVIKDVLSDESKIKFKRNSFTLRNLSDDEFTEIVKGVFEDRKKYDNVNDNTNSN